MGSGAWKFRSWFKSRKFTKELKDEVVRRKTEENNKAMMMMEHYNYVKKVLVIQRYCRKRKARRMVLCIARYLQMKRSAKRIRQALRRYVARKALRRNLRRRLAAARIQRLHWQGRYRTSLWSLQTFWSQRRAVRRLESFIGQKRERLELLRLRREKAELQEKNVDLEEKNAGLQEEKQQLQEKNVDLEEEKQQLQ